MDPNDFIGLKWTQTISLALNEALGLSGVLENLEKVMGPQTWPSDPKNPKFLKIFKIIFWNFLKDISNDAQ